MDDKVAELCVEGEPVEVHGAGDLHPRQHSQLHYWDSTHVIQRESFVEIQPTSIILAAFHMLNLIRKVKDAIFEEYPPTLILGAHSFEARLCWRA